MQNLLFMDWLKVVKQANSELNLNKKLATKPTSMYAAFKTKIRIIHLKSTFFYRVNLP